MNYALRAVVSALMLAGACVLVAVSALAVAAGLVVAVSAGGVWVRRAGVVAVLVVLAFAAFRARRRPRKRLAGVPVTSDEQPLLWVEVYRIAEGLGMRPPDELLLVSDATGVASENRTWLGLRPGRRRLRLGVPLLAGLTERQLRAVIVHDFYRCWGPNSFGRVVDRGKEIIGRVVEVVGAGSRAGRIVGRYGGAYVAVSRPVARRHELQADLFSAELAGNGATSAALREVALLAKGWEAFVEGYAAPAAAVHRRPEDFFAGFTRLLQEPTRRAQLVRAVNGAASQQPSTYDTHLPLRDRLEAVESLPDDHIRDRSGRALDMLRNPHREVRRVEDWIFHDPDLRPATWEEIVPEAGRAMAHEDALTLVRMGQEGGLGPTLSVETLLDLVRHGLADEMVRPLLAEGASPEDERQMASRLVTAFLASVAIESNTASYRLSWAEPRQMVDSRGEVEDLPRLVEAALADPAGLRAVERWLKAHGLGVELELGEDPQPTLVP